MITIFFAEDLNVIKMDAIFYLKFLIKKNAKYCKNEKIFFFP